jgi:HD-GYP domain-containing protein (c-di-GMP phosphodiesterase class II)
MSESNSTHGPEQSAASELEGKIAAALTKLGICVRNMALYGRFHPLIQESAEAAFDAVSLVLLQESEVAIAVADDYLAVGSYPIADPSGCLAPFAGMLRERQCAELRLLCGVTREELTEFAETLSHAPEELMLRGGLAAELQRRSVSRIAAKSNVMPSESRLGKDPADIYEEALLLIEEAMRALQSGLQVPVWEIRSVVSDSLQSMVDDESALLALSSIRSYDRYLAEHSVNVCILSMMLSKDLGIDSASVLELGVAAMLHDVGKVFVPGDIVKKPGRLTEEEWQQIRRHPAEGARALAGLPDLPPMAATIALEHHVRVDGTGYPALSANQRPHLLSRLVSIVDTYDALTTERPYRERWTAHQAIGWMLYETWGQYDRQLLARFASRAKLYPIGSVVMLNGGEIAVVTGGSHEHPDRPTMKLVSSESSRIDLSTCDDPAFEISAVAQPVEVLLPYTDRMAA